MSMKCLYYTFVAHKPSKQPEFVHDKSTPLVTNVSKTKAEVVSEEKVAEPAATNLSKLLRLS